MIGAIFRTGPFLFMLVGLTLLVLACFLSDEEIGKSSSKKHRSLPIRHGSYGSYSIDQDAVRVQAQQDMIFRLCWLGRTGMLVGGTSLVLLGVAFYVFSWKKGYYGDKEKVVAATLVESLQDLEPEE